MIEAFLMMGGLGLVIGAGLAAASKIFYVYVDPKITAIEDALPGANCGGCGLPGCSANAEAIVAGTAAPSSCVAANEDEIMAVASIMGVSIAAAEPDIALPGCYFGAQDAETKYIYSGVDDCRAVALHGGGMKVCTIGCLGLGTCEKSCPFDAISMGPNGLPVVNESRCTGCGTCERVCPKHIITLSSRTRRILREYTTDECTTPCQRGCPAGINIREYILQIAQGDYRRAVQVIKERNPFPTVIGRICPRPCELECRRNLVDEPVAINHLKRYAADFEKRSGERVLPYKAPETDRRIAIIGGGVEGLSTAFFSARLGHSTTVYEATAELGGLLRVAIAKERLPGDILDWDIDGILEMGVTVETNQVLGENLAIGSLLEQGYESVFLAAGGWDSRLARGAGARVESPIPGTFMFLDLMKLDGDSSDGAAIGSDVVIAGGGKLALEAAEKCRDLGAQTITIVLRESAADSALEEADGAKFEGASLNLIYDGAVHRLVGEGDQLTDIEYYDETTLAKTIVPAQTLVIASGRFPELIFARSGMVDADGETSDIDESTEISDAPPVSDEPLRWEGIQPYKKPDLKDRVGLFAEGEELTDYGAAIKAIGAGRRAAVSIHQLLYGALPSLSEDVITPLARIQDVDHVAGVPVSQRQIMPLRSPQEVATGGEIEMGFDEKTAQIEAARCLQCGLVCYNQTSSDIQIGESIAAG